MEDITLRDVMEVAFDILEEHNGINYTKKYTRKYLIEGYSQNTIPQWKWFGYSTRYGISAVVNRIFPNNINKPKSRRLFDHFIFITGYKLCNSCGKLKEHHEYSKSNTVEGLQSVCKDCAKIANKSYRENNQDKIREKSAFERAAKIQRTPKWLTKQERKDIRKFYSNCPEGSHVDHDYPLRGKEISGLHVLSNLRYLPAKENMSKSNKFDIISENNL